MCLEGSYQTDSDKILDTKCKQIYTLPGVDHVVDDFIYADPISPLPRASYAQWSITKESPASLTTQYFGIIIGVLAFFVMCMVALYYYFKWRAPNKVRNEKQITEMKEGEEVNVKRKSRARKKKMWKPREAKKISADSSPV